MLAFLLATCFAAPPAPILHLRADSGVVLDSKGAVARWIDLSPRGSRFSAPDSTQRPTTTRTGLQGRPSIHFAGRHVLADSGSLPLEGGFTLFFVAQDLNPSNNTAFLNKGPGDMSVDLWGGDAGNFQISHAWVQTIAKTDFQTSAPMLYEATWSGDSARLFVAGRLEAQGAYAGAASRHPVTWIAAAYADNRWQGFLDGQIGEILVYPGELEDSTRIRIESELLAKWGLDRLGTWMRSKAPDRTTLLLHLRADRGLVLDGDGAVEKWLDQSPRRTDFIQPDFTRRPIPSENWNSSGLRSVRFAGRHALYDTTSLPLDSPFTLFFVGQDSNPANNTALLNKGPGDMSVDLWGGDAGNFQISHAWVQTIAKTDSQTARPQLYEATWSGTRANLFWSGKLLATGSYSGIPTRAKRTTLGAVLHQGGLEGFLTGHIAEMRVYRGVLSDSLRMAIEDSLILAWNLEPSPVSILGHATSRLPGFDVAAGQASWTVSASDGIAATLLAADGAILGQARFVGGTAVLPAARGIAIVRVQGRSGTRTRLVAGLR